MAEQSKAEQKAELVAALQRSRIAFSHNFTGFRRDVDVQTHVTRSFQRHKTLFLTFAAGAGWVLARLPARKKKIYVDSDGKKKVKEAEGAGLLLVLARFLFTVFRPAIMAFATKKIASLAEKHDDRPSPGRGAGSPRHF